MGNTQETEEILRITARYVAEVQAGTCPRLSDYIVRYPQYTVAIADFVAYYHAVEVDMEEDTHVAAALSTISCSALERIEQQLLSFPTPHLPAKQLHTLLVEARGETLALSEIARELDLSVDVVEQLEQRTIDLTTIPHELARRLATFLHWSTSVIDTSLESNHRQQSIQGPSLKVAEAQATYAVLPGRSFLQAIEESAQLSTQQKISWREIAAREGL
jgi:hypothetical protein